MTVLEMLQGKKTHIIGLLMAAYGLIGLLLGQLEPNEAWQMIGTGLGLSALRDGVAKGK